MISTVTDIDAVPIERLAWLGESFFSEGKLPGTFHVEHFKATWRNLFKLRMGSMWLLEMQGHLVGGIGGIIYTGMYSPALAAVETFWYVEPAARGGSGGIRLHREFELWAALRGAATIAMIHINNLMPDSLADYYIKHKYRPVETCYIKEL